jgi:hemolysin III
LSEPKAAKPLLRGLVHQIAFFAALVAGGVLIAVTPAGQARSSIAVYAVSLAWLLGASALYHRPMWSHRVRAYLKRLDHASIFVLIGGSYTPMCLLALSPEDGTVLLMRVWVAGALGALLALAWPNRPRKLSAAVYVLIALAALTKGVEIFHALDTTTFALLAAGGVVYISGAVVYALRKPNPNPAVFGYHEVFHTLVVIACALHFVAIARIGQEAARQL